MVFLANCCLLNWSLRFRQDIRSAAGAIRPSGALKHAIQTRIPGKGFGCGLPAHGVRKALVGDKDLRQAADDVRRRAIGSRRSRVGRFLLGFGAGGADSDEMGRFEHVAASAVQVAVRLRPDAFQRNPKGDRQCRGQQNQRNRSFQFVVLSSRGLQIHHSSCRSLFSPNRWS